MFDLMRSELSALATALEEDGVQLFVGGGYGLWLKAEYLATNDIETLRDLPTPRTTQDIDIFLGIDVITDATKFNAVRDALRGLGYKPVAGAENYQFFRETTDTSDLPKVVKIDFLAPFVDDARVKVDNRRIRPRDSRGLHAHVAPEAETLDQMPFELTLEEGGSVLIPHPFTFLMLKLFAFRDQVLDEDRGLGRYHAYDLFRIVAMMTADEWDQASEIRRRFAGSPRLDTAKEIVASHFDSLRSIGMLRLREHARDVEALSVTDETAEQFIQDLAAIFRDP